MKYISLFSGIGVFEFCIQKLYPNAECIGYSEINENSIKVYNSHYPSHTNLGDITQITHDKIVDVTKHGCDLLVAGFPCTNLSSCSNLGGDNSGLKGDKSGLFFNLVEIIKIIKKSNPNVKIVVENNNSMKKIYKEQILNTLLEIIPDIEMHGVNSGDYSVQIRKRLFWSNIPFVKRNIIYQTWSDVLDRTNINIVESCSLDKLNKKIKMDNKKFYYQLIKKGSVYKFKKIIESGYTTSWEKAWHTDLENNDIFKLNGKCRPITSRWQILIDRIGGKLIPRRYNVTELHRLFGLPDNYIENLSYTATYRLLSNAIVTFPLFEILKNM